MSARRRIEPLPEPPDRRVNESLAQQIRDMVHAASLRLHRQRDDERRARDYDPDEAEQ